MTDTKEANIIITLEVQPVVKGKRKIIASASRPGEMPLIEVGHFSELNDLITRTWLGVMKRKPAPVKAAADKTPKAKPAKAKKVSAAPGDAEAENDDADNTEPAAVETEPPADQLVAAPEPEAAVEETPEPLPVIEGDVIVDTGAPDFVQAALMEEQNA